jgi:hypothetical protein
MGSKLFCVKDITDSLLVHHLHITTGSTYGRMQIRFITVGVMPALTLRPISVQI